MKRTIIALFLLTLFIVPGLNHGLWRPDEPRVAGISAEMARTNDFVVPKISGRPFLEKPPLYFMATSFAVSLLGEDHDANYRIISLIFGLLTICIAFFLASENAGVSEGLVAAGILASSWEFFMLSRWVLVDIALVCFVALAMLSYQWLMEKNRVVDAIVFALSIGLSFLVKGLVGPGIIAAAVLTDIIRRRDLGVIKKLRPLPVIGIMLLPIIAWTFFLYLRGGWPFVREVIVVNNFMRFLGSPEGATLGHQHGILFYLESFPRGFLPWIFLFIPALVASLRNFRKDSYISWFLGPFILLSLASTKRGIYLVPLYPAAACMVAHWMCERPKMTWEKSMIAITWTIAIMGCFLPFAGIFLDNTLLGLSAGMLSLAGLFLVWKRRSSRMRELSLVVIMFIALTSTSAVYFQYMKPEKDFMGFAREAITLAGDQDITIVRGDELFEVIIPMLTKRSFSVVNPSGVPADGLYLWATRYNANSSPLAKAAMVDILLEKKIGSRRAILAEVKSHPADGILSGNGHKETAPLSTAECSTALKDGMPES